MRRGWRIVGLPKFNRSFHSLLTWASDAQLLPVGVDIESILQLRNFDGPSHPFQLGLATSTSLSELSTLGADRSRIVARMPIRTELRIISVALA